MEGGAGCLDHCDKWWEGLHLALGQPVCCCTLGFLCTSYNFTVIEPIYLPLSAAVLGGKGGSFLTCVLPPLPHFSHLTLSCSPKGLWGGIQRQEDPGSWRHTVGSVLLLGRAQGGTERTAQPSPRCPSFVSTLPWCPRSNPCPAQGSPSPLSASWAFPMALATRSC